MYNSFFRNNRYNLLNSAPGQLGQFFLLFTPQLPLPSLPIFQIFLFFFVNTLFIEFFFAVITQRYVRDNATVKKVDDRCLMLDYVFLQSITTTAFVEEYLSRLRSFVSLLNNPTNSTGKPHINCFLINIHQFTPFFLLKNRFRWTNHSFKCKTLSNVYHWHLRSGHQYKPNVSGSCFFILLEKNFFTP